MQGGVTQGSLRAVFKTSFTVVLYVQTRATMLFYLFLRPRFRFTYLGLETFQPICVQNRDITNLVPWVNQGKWLMPVGLKDTYFHVPIHSSQ